MHHEQGMGGESTGSIATETDGALLALWSGIAYSHLAAAPFSKNTNCFHCSLTSNSCNTPTEKEQFSRFLLCKKVS